MVKRLSKIALVVLVPLVLIGFIQSGFPAQGEEVKPEPLRVGITPNYPPMIFNQGVNVVGVEADLARLLGEELNRPVQFVELEWGQQIPALLAGKTDIIMSGMSITKARQVRIYFTDYYVKSGLVAAFRAEDAQKYNSLKSILDSSVVVGVVEGTTGDAFVKRNIPNAMQIIRLTRASDGAFELKRRRIDIFIHDAPSIMWLVSENEADISALWEPMNEESLAWGVRKGDEEFRLQVNNILRRWKEDGTLNRILLKWLPPKYVERFK
jgi:polar amino acid transport system substrate-binding protein